MTDSITGHLVQIKRCHLILEILDCVTISDKSDGIRSPNYSMPFGNKIVEWRLLQKGGVSNRESLFLRLMFISKFRSLTNSRNRNTPEQWNIPMMKAMKAAILHLFQLIDPLQEFLKPMRIERNYFIILLKYR